MQLVSPLCSGIRGAENGFAFIDERATGVPATCYTSFEGTAIAPQPGTGFALDANGAFEVYVNQLVDVRVVDANGTAVVTFTMGEAAPNVEVRSLAFTGQDYQSGASAPGNPTTLQAILDLITTAFGSTDWNITVGGVTRTPASWLSSIAGVFTNVKDPSYGAVGDGVTDDTSHIQAALTAATSGKSIVFFPAGTYRIVSKLTIPPGVSLWGSGTEGTFIKIDHATNDLLEYGAGTDTGLQEIRGLSLDALQANSGIFVSLTSAGTRRVFIVNCLFGSVSTLHAGKNVQASTSAHVVQISDTDFYCKAADGVTATADIGRVVARNCRFFTVGTPYNNNLLTAKGYTSIAGCRFDMSTTNGSVGNCVSVGSITAGVGASGCIVGCEFTPGTSAAGAAAIIVTGANDNATAFYEMGNAIHEGFGFGVAGLTNLTAATAQAVSTYRDPRIEQLATNANVTMTGDTHGTTLITRSTNAAGQVLASNVGPPGCHYTVGVLNSSGGNIAAAGISFGVGFIATVPAFPVGAVLATGKTMWYHFRAVVVGGTAFWTPVATNIQGV